MTCRFRRGAWVAGLLLAAVPLAAAAQVGFGFGFRYRNAKYDGRVALVRARYQAYPGWAYDYPTMENNLAQVLHDISFTADLEPSLVENCHLTGGQEGIYLGSVHAMAHDNYVRRTTLRGITVTEMSMASVEENTVEDALGIGIFCSDYSMCDIRDNSIADIRADRDSSDSMREGYGIVSHYWAHAEVEDNDVARSPYVMGEFSDAHITAE